jgi:DNA-binding transcriptional LysR family regulator
LARFLPKYPEIKVEIVIDYGLTDIVAQRFDAGVRPGETVASGMISVRIAPDMRMAVVGAPAYFAERKPPKAPQDLTDHNCINLRLPTHGGLYAWEFEKHGREMNVRVDGQLVLGTATFMLMAARAGFGLAYLPEEEVRSDLESGVSLECLPTGARHFRGITSIIPAVASLRRLSPCWLKHCATAHHNPIRNPASGLDGRNYPFAVRRESQGGAGQPLSHDRLSFGFAFLRRSQLA